jgi:hypothetical protein
MQKAPDPLKAGSVDKSYLSQIPLALLNAFNTNNRIDQYLIDNLPPAAWKAKPPWTARAAPLPPSSLTCTTCA